MSARPEGRRRVPGDPVVNLRQSELMHSALTAAGVPSTLTVHQPARSASSVVCMPYAYSLTRSW